MAKSGRLELGYNIYGHCRSITLYSTTVTYLASKAIEFGENANKGYYAVQGHRGRYQSKARMRLAISD